MGKLLLWLFWGELPLKETSEIFYNFTVGVGALFASGAGIKALYEWAGVYKEKRELLKKKVWFGQAKKYYLRENINSSDGESGFRLLRNPANGYIYIYDLSTRHKYWIENMPTYYELGYQDNKNNKDWINIIDLPLNEQNKYRNFNTGESIVAT